MVLKKSSSKKVSSKYPKHGFVRASSSKGSNPFDVRGNATKQKHEVIGRRVKGAGRNVAAARAEAERKRRKTLGTEFNARNRSNVFKDKRLGEQDSTLSIEDKMMARFQTERKRKLRNASAFALHDSDSEDEEDAFFLTHKGAKITDDDYDELNRDGTLDDDESEESWKMDREIVDKLHFGGGQMNADEGAGRRKTHKEVMHEVMMKAKLFKAERQKNKSSQEDATSKLDDGFNDVRNLLEFRPTRANGKELLSSEPMDDFDKLTREFAFEARAKASERRISPEEAAAKERDRLAELEKKRVGRMNGVDDTSHDKKRTKGKQKKMNEKLPQVIVMPPTDDDLTDGYAIDAFAINEEDKEKAENSSEIDSEDESEDESENEEELTKEEDQNEQDEMNEREERDVESDLNIDKQKKQQDAKEAAAELPFVFECPESIEDLVALFEQHAQNSPEKRDQIVVRILTFYNSRLSVENKNKMKRFFAILVRQFLIYASRYADHKQDLDSMARNMYTLAQEMGDTAAVVIRELLAQLFKRLHKRTATSDWPTLPELLLFRALTLIFPTSDFRHNVVSPMETLLCESLARGTLRSTKEATQALFAASLSLDMTRAKERFMPEIVTFLTRAFRAFVSSGAQDEKCSTYWLRRDLLEWISAHIECKTPAFLPRLSLAKKSSCNGTHVMSSLLVLLDATSAQYASLPSFDELFYPLYLLLHALVKQLNTITLVELNAVISKLHVRLESCWDARRPLRLQSFAPVTLPTFAPNFDENYSVRKDKMAPKDAAQLKQLKRQVKRARKGAARELRRDAEFIHREKQKEEETRLAAKEEKQKEIRRWLEEQNATFNQQVRKGGNMLKGGGSARGPAPRARISKK
ncbi:nucleolar protein [Plasmopara halstedii]|uniref:Nucleolar protein n=1 Tax=Plasmopara halstedii TaxID=4781 RepID=A0A0P1AZF3_PLAHL|nr:nucleolar protein [Plasmopara halstedii]CEG47068.1 nucleolar protein [Plasmopara halstedii]|eukprot:XP_024583437.1 nucleolar protein [Plasmopara halstedii]